MNLKTKLDLKLGSDLREKIGEVMIFGPFVMVIFLAIVEWRQ